MMLFSVASVAGSSHDEVDISSREVHTEASFLMSWCLGNVYVKSKSLLTLKPISEIVLL